jgi:hypothetical protein
MEIIILTKQDLQDFEQKLDKILLRVDALEPGLSRKSESYLTRNQVKDMLHITLPTLHNWTVEGRLPYSKIGQRVFYKLSDVEDLIDRNMHGKLD